MCSGLTNFPHKATLFHVLNNCQAFLGENERMTWRHNSILSYIANTIIASKPEHIKVYSDLSEFQVNGGSIPPNILVTASRPDLVILDSKTNTIFLYELTVCFERNGNFEAAHQRKATRYTSLALDLEEKGLKFTISLLKWAQGGTFPLTTN